jgi:hypothetical protein
MFHVYPILMPWAGPSHVVYDEVGRFIDRLVEGYPTYESATDRTAVDDDGEGGGDRDGSGSPATDDGGAEAEPQG